MARRKLLEIDGAQFTISPLTLKQTEDVVDSKARIEDAQKDVTNRRAVQSIMFETVLCPGLNNALSKDVAEAEKWTPERVFDEMDLVLAMKLQNEILMFSGLAPEVPDNKFEVKPKEGEVQAVAIH